MAAYLQRLPFEATVITEELLMQTIFIHGLGQAPSSWDKTIAGLSEQITSQCPDLSQFLKGAESTYENLYRGFSEYCYKFSDPVNLCGLSLGAVLALNYAVDNPCKVSSLVLTAPQFEMPKKLLKFQNMIFRIMPESAFRETGFGKKDFITLTNSMADLNFRKGLEKVLCPALILCGEKDKANRKAAIKLAQLLPDAELSFVENSGHEVNADAPDRLAEITENFYEGIFDRS